jgi:acyl dehydratase
MATTQVNPLGRGLDDLEEGIVFESRGRTVTETDIVNFAALSADWNPLHTDREWAAGSFFGERIAHGLLVLSIASGLWDIDPNVVVGFYGIDKLRFTAPTRIGDTIRVRLEITGLRPKGDEFGVIELAQTVLNQRDEKVIAATVKLLIRRKALQPDG